MYLLRIRRTDPESSPPGGDKHREKGGEDNVRRKTHHIHPLCRRPGRRAAFTDRHTLHRRSGPVYGSGRREQDSCLDPEVFEASCGHVQLSAVYEAMDLVDQISQFDECGMMTIISMIIDTASAKYKEPAGDIAYLVCATVHAVNAELGPYQLDTEEGL